MRRLLISLAAVLLSASCYAQYSGGSGTAGDPYLISSPGDIVLLGSTEGDWGKHFVLVNDIDLAGVSVNRIGFDYHDGDYFVGSFDGGGHVLRNLTMHLPEAEFVGLFGHIGGGGEIRNLLLEGGSVRGDDYVGGLVGRSEGGNILNCCSTGSVSGDHRVGGLVGGTEFGTITNCFSTESVVDGRIYVGGLVGVNLRCSITNCYSRGSVMDGEEYVGGLVGGNYGIITSCYSTGSVSGEERSGGLTGYNGEDAITGCFWDVQTSGMSYSRGGMGFGLRQRIRCMFNSWPQRRQTLGVT